MSLDRLILYGDLPPQEQPLNHAEELWIEIKSNEVDRAGEWLLRKIVAQCDTGEVKIADKDGNDERIIDLLKYSYHFVKPPSGTVSASTDPVTQEVQRPQAGSEMPAHEMDDENSASEDDRD